MMGDLPNGDVLVGEDRLCSGLVQMAVSSSSSAANPDPESVGAESWNSAEEAAREVIDAIHPTASAHWKRTGVVDYVNRLFISSLGIQVFPYGSVPLKTYLPDGDIDLTAISSPAFEDAMVTDVYAVLRGEEHNEDAPYEIKDVHHIDAEVFPVLNVLFLQSAPKQLCFLWRN
uniref:Uncharacterized protein MANES_09G116700 n=1 Tax=Rhizophora mucronata TaxID=61149 RepID=A0A2P2KFE7_RHIMU